VFSARYELGLEIKLSSIRIIYTVSTQQHQYSNIMYVTGYTVATCFDRKRSS